MAIVHVALDMEIAIYANSPIVAELEKAAALVNEPKLTLRHVRRHLLIREASANDDTLFHIPLLRNNEHLITGTGGTDQSPTASHPL
jgi:hypothetical protein